VVVAVVVGLLIAYAIGQPHWVQYRRRRVRERPFPEAWRSILRRRMPYLRAMPADLQLQLKKHIQVFLSEKIFIGCAGVTITDEIRVTIAAQACLLLLNRDTDYYPKLTQILVYPGAFVVARPRTDNLGLVSERRQVLTGESWQQGQVILSWQQVSNDSHVPDDGHNVVIHEFAHQLDHEKGEATGAPLLERAEQYREWSEVWSDAFAQLQQQAERQEPSLFDHYGATSPAEFFAVASEVFFEQPQELVLQYPALYRQLRDYYHLDPASWN